MKHFIVVTISTLIGFALLCNVAMAQHDLPASLDGSVEHRKLMNKTMAETEADCSSAPSAGMCLAYMRRFFFNPSSSRCEEFVYGGCQGNGNNYKTQEECSTSCAAATAPDCSSPAVTGPCRASIPSYFFNSVKARCEQFVYGGCGGNGNRYDTLDKCKQICGATDGSGDASKATAPDCSSPAVTGPCRAAIQSYFFNTVNARCEKFLYGGCGGNGNRYDTLDQCKELCGTIDGSSNASKATAPDCSSPAVTGPCRASIPSYFFNSVNARCEQFLYGGCGGNGNRYDTLDKCKELCGATAGSGDVSKGADCRSPALTGPCKARFERFFYNTKSKRCEKFVYGGCKRNGNNYKTLTQCQQSCTVSKPPAPR